MKAILEPLLELGEFGEIYKNVLEKRGTTLLTGCVDSQKLHIAHGLGREQKYRVILTYSDQRARELAEDCQFFDKNTVVFPAKDLIFFQADIHGNELTRQRLQALRLLLEGESMTLITTFDSLLSPQISPERFLENVIDIEEGARVEPQALAKLLVNMGYENTTHVEAPGQFGIRGGIVDIFDLTQDNPCRIEFWGDDVDSIRLFDVATQRSVEQVQKITICPATEMILPRKELENGIHRICKEADSQIGKLREQFQTEAAARLTKQIKELKEKVLEFGMTAASLNLDSYMRYFYEDLTSFLDYFPKNGTVWFLDEPIRVLESANAVFQEFSMSMTHRLEGGYVLPGQADLLFSVENMMARLSKLSPVLLSTLDTKIPGVTPDFKYDIQTRNIAPYNNSFESLVKDLKRFQKEKYRVILLSGSRTRAERLAQDLTDEGVTAFYSENPDRILDGGEIMVRYGRIRKGFEYQLLKFAVISDTDIFGSPKKKKKKKYSAYSGQKIVDFSDLHVGDYVVHETHGLGVYRGIEKVEVDHVVKDYMKISYRDGGNLFIPATGLDLLQKYSAAEGAAPKLSKLGTQEWTKTKTKVRMAVNAVAENLVRLYAGRSVKAGYCYGEDTVWQREFEELFPYDETDDQLSAIEATKADMESSKIMDRLICGDVGFGKTEIAIRAAFKAVQENKQVVYLVPTTVLAQQHYNTFVQRMKDYPVRIDLMSRFRSAASIRKTVTDLKKGLVDIVIGTHRVLSKDVQFKDLGLLIIDEEQRFGVSQKEKIKELKETVDVLTLTATPIPRTLHMSLVGVRDMSLLEEAPEDRLPIQTFVCEYNDEMVREAITRELSRGGQVYYVHNRVNDIADVTEELQKMLPDAVITYAHGQMKEHEIEPIMYDFVNGEIDVLVSTTIIETGLDIPNVNTIIVRDSDRFGLSQLYQLRGRVGRSNRTAYAFLMYKRDRMLTETAEKRLSAIREFTDLGSGYRIAMRDLEIRGAGNMLGTVQSGNMEAVGYELYCKMLGEAIKELTGEKEVVKDFQTVVDLDVDAYIPPVYIVNESQKLEIYKRIAVIETQEEASDMRDELTDRFGNVPLPVDNLLRIALLRSLAHRLYMTEIKGKAGQIRFQMTGDAKVKVEAIPELIQSSGGKLKFEPMGTPSFVFRYKRPDLVEVEERLLLDLTERLLIDGFERFLLPKETE